MIEIKALDQLTKLGNSISLIRNKMQSISSYAVFVNLRSELNEKLSNIDSEIKALVNSVVFHNEKIEEYKRRNAKHESSLMRNDKPVIANQFMNVDNYDKALFINSNNAKQSYHKFDRTELNFNYDEYKPIKYSIDYSNVNHFPKYKFKSNSATPSHSSKGYQDKAIKPITNYDYTHKKESSEVKSPKMNNSKEVQLPMPSGELSSGTPLQKQQSPLTQKEIQTDSVKEKDKITRIQDIVLQAYQNELTLQYLESKFGKEFSILITSDDISLEFISSVESALFSFKPPPSI